MGAIAAAPSPKKSPKPSGSWFSPRASYFHGAVLSVDGDKNAVVTM